MPTPGHTEIIEIDPDFANENLTRQLIAIFADNNISPCNGNNRHYDDLQECFVPWFQGRSTRILPNEAIIEIGKQPGIFVDEAAGHTAKIFRTSKNTIAVTVRGYGVYYTDIPNKEVAVKLGNIIRDELKLRKSP